MKALFKKILSIGLNKIPKNEHKKTKLLNGFSLCWFIFICIFISIDYYLLHSDIFIKNVILHIISLLILVFIFFLQKKGFITTARIMFTFAITFSGWSFCYLEPGKLMELYFIITPLFSLTFIKNKWINISVLIFAFSINILNFETITENKDLNYALLVLFSIYIGAYLILNYSQNLNRKQELALAKERDNALSDKMIIEAQAKKLKKLNEFKSHFFVNLSHEIRTPITLIKGYTSQINANGDKENKQKLDIVKNQIQQIEGIINNILDLSKLDANKLNLNLTDIEIDSFLNKQYADFKMLFENKKIAFHLNNNTKGLTVSMDINLISKSITNLLSNALKFTSKNGVVAINSYVEDTIGNLIIEITDNGIGIPKEDLNKIFERFYQSKNDITKSQGSGIGLSFTQNIIKAHGFDINVTSIPNIKTIFKISIPKKYISKHTKKNKINITEISEETKLKINSLKSHEYKKSPTILIVDDHEQMRNYLSLVLNNYNIVEAENGKEALEILKKEHIDLLVTDYMMPVMNGDALVKDIKNQQLKIPIIMLTARMDDFAKLKMLRVGVDGYLNKPFVEEELLLTIKNSLKLYNTVVKTQQTLTYDEKEDVNTYYDATFHQQITEFILRHITDKDFTVIDIAEHFNVSQSTLNRRMKSTLGQTAKQTILQIKIEKARELYLKNPNLSKKEIGFMVGIKNTSHLFLKIAEKYGNHYNS